MKKRKLVLLLAIILFATVLPVTVAADEPQITAIVDERTTKLYTVNMTLDNQYLASDVPPVLMEFQQEYRTLVPVAAVAAYTGAEVSWDGDREEVTITKGDKTILLKINSAVVMVNGEEKVLPSQVPAKIVTYQNRGRTMVPVAFVGQELGLEIGWDGNTRTVKIVTPEPVKPEPEPDAPEIVEEPDLPDHTETEMDGYVIEDISVLLQGDIPEIRIKTGGELSYSTALLTDPERIVFDFSDSLLMVTDNEKLLQNKTVRVTAPDNPYLTGVRSSQFDINPNIVRLVMDMKESIGYEVSYDKDNQEMVIQLINYVDDVRLEQFNTREVVVIDGSDVSNYNTMHLDNPHRLVVDIKESVLNPSRRILDQVIDGRMIERVRVSEFKPDHHYDPDDKIVRVVVDLTRKLNKDDLFIQQENGSLRVHLEGEPDQGYRYEETGWTTSRLTFFGENQVDYRVDVEANGEILKVSMPSDNMNVPFEQLDVDDIMLKFIQTTRSSNGRELIADIHLKPGVLATANGLENTRDLVLNFTNSNLKYREKLIIIDPGHGGSDPGAISVSMKMREKDINLEVAREAKRLLESAGFRVSMTRTDDTSISIQDRAEVANQLQADLFISIHSNSAPRADLKGVETLYFPSEKQPMDFRNNKFLAEIFQNEMVRVLGAESHRINAREKLVVLRETRMPAIITEIGFLSNVEEERLLATSEYKQRAAEGVLRSVIRYFEESSTHLAGP